MADTADLGSVTVRCGGSSPSMPTRIRFSKVRCMKECIIDFIWLMTMKPKNSSGGPSGNFFNCELIPAALVDEGETQKLLLLDFEYTI